MLDEDERVRHDPDDPHQGRHRLRDEAPKAHRSSRGDEDDAAGAGDPAGPDDLAGDDAGTAAAVDSTRASGRDAKPARKGGVLRETAIVVVSALVLSVLIKTFLVQAFYIPSGSMEDTLAVGDRVLVSKLTPGTLDINRGDVVVFVDPGNWLDHEPPERGPVREVVENVLTFVGLLPQNAGEHLIKRVIGVGGDTVACCDEQGRLTVNGQSIDEPYLKPGVEPSQTEFSVRVPPDHLWFMGDNRSNSQDSRSHRGEPGGGAVPLDHVEGNAFLIMWPIDHWSLLRSPGDVFAEVPDP